MVKEIQSVTEFKELATKGAVLVDFFATWCGPCKVISPVIEKLEKEYTSVKFLKVDIEQVTELSREFNISAVPTIIIFQNGKPVDTIKGANPGLLKNTLDKYT